MKLTHEEINFLLEHAKSNRADSAALAEIPGQRWAAAHRDEVKMMDQLIEKLEDMKKPNENHANGMAGHDKLLWYDRTLEMLVSTARTMTHMDSDGSLTEHGKGSLERTENTICWLKGELPLED